MRQVWVWASVVTVSASTGAAFAQTDRTQTDRAQPNRNQADAGRPVGPRGGGEPAFGPVFIEPTPAQPKPVDLRRIDQTFEDVGPLRTSMRALAPDLREDVDFRHVYRVSPDSPSPYAGWFVRRAGAITAVFPRSQYDEDKNGVRPVTPANVQYYLGTPPDLIPGATDAAPARRRPGVAEPLPPDRAPVPTAMSNRVDPAPLSLKIDTHAAAEPLGGRTPTPPPTSAEREAELIRQRTALIFMDDQARDERVGRLLSHALVGRGRTEAARESARGEKARDQNPRADRAQAPAPPIERTSPRR